MATQARRARRRSRTGPSPTGSSPKVHVKVACADMDLGQAAHLVKPAILYADSVTLYSPAAALAGAVFDVAGAMDTGRQWDHLLSIAESVPHLAKHLDAEPGSLRAAQELARLPVRERRRVLKAAGVTEGVDRIVESFDEVNAVWKARWPEALEQVAETLNAHELLVAVNAGAVRLAPLGSAPPTDLVASTLRAATGATDPPGSVDLVGEFMSKLHEIIADPRAFPLLDADAAGLAQLVVSSPARATEISLAVSLMDCLPAFPSLPMDEALDLRKALAAPLIRFRGAVARMSRTFESRPYDDAFRVEVEDAWRREVAPALADIREALAEHGFLREVASVALGDPRRLMAEAGGVLYAANGFVPSLSKLIDVGFAAGSVGVDVAGRALRRSTQVKREARKNAFYFLAKLDSEASSHG